MKYSVSRIKKWVGEKYYNFSTRKPKLITVFDSYAGKKLQLLLRNDSFMERLILEKGLYGDWEKESLKIWAMLAKISPVILDIGANTGIFSLIAKNNNANSVVVAIEPVDINFSVLSTNIEANQFNILKEKVGLSNKVGEAKMFMLKDRLNYMTSINDNRYYKHPEITGNHPVEEITIQIDTFDKVYRRNKLTSVDLIKIDTEGHEYVILENMLPYIKAHQPSILIEIIDDDSNNAEKIQNMFDKLGYKYISMDEVNTSKVVSKLWDNDHHNFLLTNQKVIDYLVANQLVTY
jgi:FkbM family methyltransferase